MFAASHRAMAMRHCSVIFLLAACVSAFDVKPSLVGAPWRPMTAGGCQDEHCCSQQCSFNGHTTTTPGQLSCVAACLLRVSGVSQEAVDTQCREPPTSGFLNADETCPTGPGLVSSPSPLHACLAGALLGTEPLVQVTGSPERLSPKSFYWEMEAGGGMTGRGFSWYTRIFGLFKEGHAMDVQMGMGGTWLVAHGIEYDICPCKNGEMGDCCAYASCDCCSGLAQSLEGGPGYWQNQLPTTRSKWRVGDSVGCYSYYTGSPLFQFGDYDGHDCSHMGLAQVSNQMLMLPDGLTFDEEGMIGVAYAHTPLGKTSASDSRNFWTVILDTENFAGPLAYFLPEFWALRPRGYEAETAHLGDYGTCPLMSQGAAGSFEWNTLETYKASNGVYKIPKMTLPYRNGRSVLMMNNRVFEDDSQIAIPIEEALSTGKFNASAVMPTDSGKRRQCPTKSEGDARFNVEGGMGFSAGVSWTTVEAEECVWSVQARDTAGATPTCASDGDCELPQYISKDFLPISESEAPSDLKAQAFRTKTGGSTYDQITDRGHTCVSSPGPALDTLYCSQTLKGGDSSTWVGYKWYKFVDQPGLQQAKLTSSEKAYMQARIENLHKVQTRTTRWMTAKRAVDEGLAVVDGASLVTPPKGFEHGYVPIAVYEGLRRPQGCTRVAPSPTPPSPPRPTPPSPPTPPFPPAPPPPTPPPTPPLTPCETSCHSNGHCCIGAVSSYSTPSCAMGCTIAEHTSSEAECQQMCRDNDHTCSWSVAGIQMTNCGNCPANCDASDGVQECLDGCTYAHTPAPPPAPPPPPPLTPCETSCHGNGHCCVGRVSSYNSPSCAMGCTIAEHTSSEAECQQMCRDNDHTCSWSVAGIQMNNCGDCPANCDASDGVQECLSGCSYASKWKDMWLQHDFVL